MSKTRKPLGPSRLHGQTVQMGQSFHLESARDYESEMEQAFERMKEEYTQKAQARAREIIEKAKEMATEVVQQAEAKAEEVMQDGENRRESVLKQAYDDGERAGYDKGYSDGFEQAEQETVRLLKGAQTILDGTYQAEERVLKNFQKNAAQLITHVCNRILADELATSPEKLNSLIHQAIEALNLSGRVKVVTSAEVLERIQSYSPQTNQALKSLERLEFVADPALNLNEIYVISEETSFDLTVAHQVERVVETIESKIPLPMMLEDVDHSETIAEFEPEVPLKDSSEDTPIEENPGETHIEKEYKPGSNHEPEPDYLAFQETPEPNGDQLNVIEENYAAAQNAGSLAQSESEPQTMEFQQAQEPPESSILPDDSETEIKPYTFDRLDEEDDEGF